MKKGALETKPLIIMHLGASLVVQQLRPYTSPTGDMGLIPGQGTKILHAAWQWLKTKQKTHSEADCGWQCPKQGHWGYFNSDFGHFMRISPDTAKKVFFRETAKVLQILSFWKKLVSQGSWCKEAPDCLPGCLLALIALHHQPGYQTAELREIVPDGGPTSLRLTAPCFPCR